MLTDRTQYKQVLRSIVSAVMVPVMNDLARLQQTMQDVLLRHKPMLIHVTSTVHAFPSIAFWCEYSHVASLRNKAPALPLWALFATLGMVLGNRRHLRPMLRGTTQ